jgi:uncharacterized membrane protein YdjX (TVP38/TMEM64 family)
MESSTNSTKRKQLLKLAVVAAALAALGLAILLGVDVPALIQTGLDLVRQAGPVAFFLSMAFLPALGVPMLTFVLLVAPVFEKRLGLPLVFLFSLSALTFNLVFTYVLARWLLRPPLQRLVEKLGYKIPEVEGSDATDLLVILRVTPGVPFCVQNYMSGLAQVPLRTYLIISCLVAWAYNTAFIFFGDALLHGKGRVIVMLIGVIAALAAGTHMLRRHYAAKRTKKA